MSDNHKNILEKAGDKAKELGHSIKEGMDNLVHGTAADKKEVVDVNGSNDIGRTLDRCNDKNSPECQFVREKAGGYPEMQQVHH